MNAPSFAGLIITVTVPNMGNGGTNAEDIEADSPQAIGMIGREDVTAPSNVRSVERRDQWMKDHARIGLAGVASGLAITGVAAVAMLTPLKTVAPYVITVDKATGASEITASMSGNRAINYNDRKSVV